MKAKYQRRITRPFDTMRSNPEFFYQEVWRAIKFWIKQTREGGRSQCTIFNQVANFYGGVIAEIAYETIQRNLKKYDSNPKSKTSSTK